MEVARQREELVHVRRTRRTIRERLHAKRFERQAQQALVLIQGLGLIARLRLRAHDDAGDQAAAVQIVRA